MALFNPPPKRGDIVLPKPQAEIPPRLAERPRYKGLPITFVTFVDQHGVPDFKVLNAPMTALCANERRCALCGHKLEEEIVFAGGPACEEYHQFLDPPMHEECCRYAFVTCPFIALGRDYAKHYKDHDADIQVIGEGIRAPEMGMFFTDGYQIIGSPEQWAFLANEWTKVEWKDG